jgi:branched-chain amino acid transport system permease protein
MFLQLIISGVLLGGVYALLGIGLSLIFGVSKFTNFAHGDFVMCGMYIAFSAFTAFSLSPYFSWPIVIIIAVILGSIVFFFARFTIGKPGVNQILFTLGLSMVLRNIALLFYKADYKSIPSDTKSFAIGKVYISMDMLIIFIIAVVITIAFLLFLKYTNTGRAMRAVGDDRNASYLMGISVGRIDWITFCLGTTLACIAGGLLMTVYPTTPTIGSSFNLIAWVIVILGGLGHLQGALISAVLIGVCENISGFYLGADMRQAVYFILFIIVLVFRPQGLFAGLGMKKVKRT